MIHRPAWRTRNGYPLPLPRVIAETRWRAAVQGAQA